MAKVQKVYKREFKEEAVGLAQTSGKPITHIARELGISDASIHQWRKELAQHGTSAFPGSGHQTALEEEKSSSQTGFAVTRRSDMSDLSSMNRGGNNTLQYLRDVIHFVASI